jgi:hypothetical protein
VSKNRVKASCFSGYVFKEEVITHCKKGAKVMKKQLVIIGIIALLVSVGLSGCTSQTPKENNDTISPEKSKFVGTWKNTTSYLALDLSSDGTCKMWSYPGTWDLMDGKLVIDLESLGVHSIYTYIFIFFNNDKTLKLIPTIYTTGKSYVLYKQ